MSFNIRLMLNNSADNVADTFTVIRCEFDGTIPKFTIILNGLYLTDDEKGELESILNGGVYL